MYQELSKLMKNMQQKIKRFSSPTIHPSNPQPISFTLDEHETKKAHLANLTTQVFCALLANYSNSFSLGNDQIDQLIKTSHKIATRIDELSRKKIAEND